MRLSNDRPVEDTYDLWKSWAVVHRKMSTGPMILKRELKSLGTSSTFRVFRKRNGIESSMKCDYWNGCTIKI